MPARLALFPLNTVLFPGMTIPLHVFEQRYRRLVSELLGSTGTVPGSVQVDGAGHRFGIVGIELGHEVAGESGQAPPGSPAGSPALPKVSGIGCAALVRTVRAYEDGRYDLVVEGGERFAIEEVTVPGREIGEPGAPYTTAAVRYLPELPGPDAAARAGEARRLFDVYCARLAAVGLAADPALELPGSAVELSYALAAAVVLDQHEKQELLEAEHAAARLRLVARLLRRENRMLALESLPTLPAGPFVQHGVSLN